TLPAPCSTPMPARQPRTVRRQITLPSRADRGAPVATTRHAAWLWAYHRALDANGMVLARLIGVDVDIRSRDEPDLVGPCVNTLPVVLPDGVADHNGELASGAAIARLLPHAGIPITDVVPPPRRPTGDPRQPFFRYNLVYQAAEYPTLRLGGKPTRYHGLPPGISEHTITLFVRESTAGAQLELAWDAQLVDAAVAHEILTATVARFSGQKEGHR
ncbi:MAG TPA: hypothetical protein VM347_19650, partial [Nonomuraea sp.]|nr:hypothetical protein [Nonomuraea sp.]